MSTVCVGPSAGHRRHWDSTPRLGRMLPPRTRRASTIPAIVDNHATETPLVTTPALNTVGGRRTDACPHPRLTGTAVRRVHGVSIPRERA